MKSQPPTPELPYLLPNQAQKQVTLNESLQRLDTLVQTTVTSHLATNQLSGEKEVQTYILPEGATGPDWGSMPTGAPAVFGDGTWTEFMPKKRLARSCRARMDNPAVSEKSRDASV
jgi:hypothetical protein